MMAAAVVGLGISPCRSNSGSIQQIAQRGFGFEEVISDE
jgi:hypothetical protein